MGSAKPCGRKLWRDVGVCRWHLLGNFYPFAYDRTKKKSALPACTSCPDKQTIWPCFPVFLLRSSGSFYNPSLSVSTCPPTQQPVGIHHLAANVSIKTRTKATTRNDSSTNSTTMQDPVQAEVRRLLLVMQKGTLRASQSFQASPGDQPADAGAGAHRARPRREPASGQGCGLGGHGGGRAGGHRGRPRVRRHSHARHGVGRPLIWHGGGAVRHRGAERGVYSAYAGRGFQWRCS